MKTSFLKYSLVVFMVFLYSNAAAQTNFKLEYKFQKGETYRFANRVITNVVQQAMGQEVKVDITADAIQRIVGEDKVDGNMVLITSLDSVVVSTKMPMRDTTMNLDSFKDKRTRIVLDPTGEIVKKEILDTLGADAQQFEQLNSQSLKFFDLPKEEVKTGSTWSTDDVDTIGIMGGNMISNSKTEYTLAGEEERSGYKCVKITFTSSSTNEGQTKMMGMDLFIEGTGKITGNLYFAPEQGIMILAEVQSDNDMTMATTGEQKMIIPITQSSKITQSYIK